MSTQPAETLNELMEAIWDNETSVNGKDTALTILGSMEDEGIRPAMVNRNMLALFAGDAIAEREIASRLGLQNIVQVDKNYHQQQEQEPGYSYIAEEVFDLLKSGSIRQKFDLVTAIGAEYVVNRHDPTKLWDLLSRVTHPGSLVIIFPKLEKAEATHKLFEIQNIPGITFGLRKGDAFDFTLQVEDLQNLATQIQNEIHEVTRTLNSGVGDYNQPLNPTTVNALLYSQEKLERTLNALQNPSLVLNAIKKVYDWWMQYEDNALEIALQSGRYSPNDESFETLLRDSPVIMQLDDLPYIIERVCKGWGYRAGQSLGTRYLDRKRTGRNIDWNTAKTD